MSNKWRLVCFAVAIVVELYFFVPWTNARIDSLLGSGVGGGAGNLDYNVIMGTATTATTGSSDEKKKDGVVVVPTSTTRGHGRERLEERRRSGEQRIVLFVHFHKAGGTSMIRKFHDGGYQMWNRKANGNPKTLPEKLKHGDLLAGNATTTMMNEFGRCRPPDIPQHWEMLQFWRYGRSAFEAFLRDGRTQPSWRQCLSIKERQDPSFLNPLQTSNHTGVEFMAMEWNFFRHDHFFSQPSPAPPTSTKDYLRTHAKLDLITILRDPYDRFISNFYFNNPLENYDNPLEWAHLDLIKVYGSEGTYLHIPNDTKIQNAMEQHLQEPTQNYQYGQHVPSSWSFRVNFNKPNYYTAYLNGMTENTDTPSGADADTSAAPFDFDYFAFGLNQTHLDVAKHRLEQLFDAILILERPETHIQLDRWFAPSSGGGSRSGSSNDTTTSGSYYYPHDNQRKESSSSTTTEQLLRNNFTRDDFYRYNALDKELYEFAVQLALRKSAETRKRLAAAAAAANHPSLSSAVDSSSSQMLRSSSSLPRLLQRFGSSWNVFGNVDR